MVTATFTIPDFHRIDSAHAGRTKGEQGTYRPLQSNTLYAPPPVPLATATAMPHRQSRRVRRA